MTALDATPKLAPEHSRGLVGRTVSHFRVVDLLGAGGMGVVYRAIDLELERSVALKFLPAERMRDERSRRRLVREARSASRVDHPNVCAVHEIGRTEDGDLFIAMAYYEGETLKRLARSRCPESGAQSRHRHPAGSRAGRRSCEVGSPSRRQAWECHVTPAGEVKILDFGLALRGHDTLSTAAGAAGTFLHVARASTLSERRRALGSLVSRSGALRDADRAATVSGRLAGAHRSFDPECQAATIVEGASGGSPRLREGLETLFCEESDPIAISAPAMSKSICSSCAAHFTRLRSRRVQKLGAARARS